MSIVAIENPQALASLKPQVANGSAFKSHELTSLVSSAYFLPSDEDERDRLDRQSRYLTKSLFNGQLIFAPLIINPEDKILENATGTGIWLMGLAQIFPPTVSLTGIDIQTRLFPVQHPSNVTFLHRSVTDLPESWSNTFKLVHQRLLTTALTADQWKSALSEAYRVLVPGGWIQLLETGPETKACSGPNMKRIVDSQNKVYSIRGLVPNIQHILGELLCEAGFINVTHTQDVGLPKPDAQDLEEEEREHRTTALSFLAAAKQGLLTTGNFESEEEFDRVLEGMEKEWASWPSSQGCLRHWSFACAQKPT